MKITRKNATKEITMREVERGQVFEVFEVRNSLYMKVYDADTDIRCFDCCFDCNEETDFSDNCLAVSLDDGGLYSFSPYEKVIIKECEVIVNDN